MRRPPPLSDLPRFPVFPVANVAHGMGAILGALIALAAIGPRPYRALATVGLIAVFGLSVAAATVGRLHVNFSKDEGWDFAMRGYRNLQAGDNRHAVLNLRKAVTMRNVDAEWWY